MTTDAPEPDMTAAELALGLLDGEDRAAALRRVLSDPDFARDVEQWRKRLAGLFDDYPDVAAPESVAARLASPDVGPAPVPVRPTGWRIAAIAATAIAAMLALFVVLRPVPQAIVPPPAHRTMVAALAMSGKSGAVPAVVDMTAGEVRIGEAAIAPRGKSAQLWMIGGDGVPRPMGLLAAGGPSRMTLSDGQRDLIKAGIVLAVSIEPLGGSPTGRPTGPVVASGKLSIA
ncbi:MAG TPA: anti-sigma factor [Sphingomonas sp.]